MSKEIVKINAEKISQMTNYSVEEVAVVKANIAKNVNDSELAYFLNVCKTVELNPFNREIWCYKDKLENLLIFAGRDGFLSKAQSNPLYNGMRSCEVCSNDDFKMNIATGEISHIPEVKDRGIILGAYSIVFRKDGEPTIEWADFEVYNRGFGAWKTHPAEMIKKVAETHALKKAFGISGIQAEYDYNIKNDVATPINTELEEVTEEDRIQDLQNQVNDLIRNETPAMKKEFLTKMQNEAQGKGLSVDWLVALIDEITEKLNKAESDE